MYELKIENLLEDALANMHQDHDIYIKHLDDYVTCHGFNCGEITGKEIPVSVYVSYKGSEFTVKFKMDMTKEIRSEFINQLSKAVRIDG